MDIKTKKYLSKRKKIMDIIENMVITYETDKVYIQTNPDYYSAKDAAEKILSKFGLNKPKELDN